MTEAKVSYFSVFNWLKGSKLTYFFGVFLQLLGLSGLVDGIITWYGFFGDLVANYNLVRDLFFDFIHLNIPTQFKNYLVIGLGVNFAFIEQIIWGFEGKGIFRPKSRDNVVVKIGFIVLYSITMWPFVLLTVSVETLIFAVRRDSNRRPVLKFWAMLIFVYFMFLVAVFLWSNALSKILSA